MVGKPGQHAGVPGRRQQDAAMTLGLSVLAAAGASAARLARRSAQKQRAGAEAAQLRGAREAAGSDSIAGRVAITFVLLSGPLTSCLLCGDAHSSSTHARPTVRRRRRVRACTALMVVVAGMRIKTCSVLSPAFLGIYLRGIKPRSSCERTIVWVAGAASGGVKNNLRCPAHGPLRARTKRRCVAV